jgi:hypothetical protein
MHDGWHREPEEGENSVFSAGEEVVSCPKFKREYAFGNTQSGRSASAARNLAPGYNAGYNPDMVKSGDPIAAAPQHEQG